MNKTARFFLFLYRIMLRFYPVRFRQEYSEEMQTVFCLQLEHIQGNFKTFLAGWRELLDLPPNILQAHLRQKRESLILLEKRFNFQPGSWQEILLACMPLLLMGLIPALLSFIPGTQTMNTAAAISLLIFLTICLIGLGIIGLLAKLPRWAAGYTVIPLALFILGGLALVNYFDTLAIPHSWGFTAFISIFQGFFLLLLALAVFILLQITARLKAFSSFMKRLRNDPSLLSFMFYGAALVIILGQYEEFTQGSPYLILSILALGLGIWGYLGSNKRKSKTTALVSGSSLACLLTLTANLIAFGMGQASQFSQEILWRVVFSIFINWLSIQVLILAPLVLPFDKNRRFSKNFHTV